MLAEEIRIHDPDHYSDMVARAVYDAFYMLNGQRMDPDCRKKIFCEFVPWISERIKEFDTANPKLLDPIQVISRCELLEDGVEVHDSHEQIKRWVHEIATS